MAQNFLSDIKLGDNISIRLGDATNGDLQIYHNGTSDFIRSNGTYNIFEANNHIFRNLASNEDYAKFLGNGAVELYHNGSKKFETTAGGVNITGTIDASGTIVSTGGNIRVGSDTGKFLAGASNDLQIYHDGSHSYIADTGTGELRLRSDGVSIQSANGNEYMAFFAGTGAQAVSLYAGNAVKFQTASTGVIVTGNADPAADSTYDLGTDAVRWANVYADNLHGDGSNLTGVAADESRTIILKVKNKSGGSLSKGTLVHASPSANPPSGNTIEVIAAENDVEAKMPALGVLNEALADEAEGECVVLGSISGISTTDDGTSTGTLFSTGDFLYVSDIAGLFTNVKPTGTKLIQKIGIVIKAHTTNGTVQVFGIGRTNDVPTPLYIDHANQRVGIGETNPSRELEISGNGTAGTQIQVTGTQDSAGIKFVPASGNQFEVQASTSSEWFVYDRTNNAYRLRINSSGNVGIGVASPSNYLQVAASTTNSSIRTGGLEMQSYAVNNGWYAENLYFDGAWRLRSAGYATQMYMGTGTINFVRFANGAAGDSVTPISTMYLNASGNVGIGTSSPNNNANRTTLTLNHATSGGVLAFAVNDSRKALLYTETTTNNLIVQAESGESIKLNTSGSNTALTLDASQNATFAGTVTINDNAPLIVNGNDPLISFQNSATNHWQVGLENTNSDRFVFYDNNAAAYQLILESTSGNATFAGDVTVTGDLIVNGTETILNTETVEVEDNIIVLNKTGTSMTATTSGISVYRGASAAASFIFNDSDDDWDLTHNLAVAGDIKLADNNKIKGTTYSAGFISFESDGETRISANDDVVIGYGETLNISNTGVSTFAGDVTISKNGAQLRLKRVDGADDDWRFYSWASGLNIYPQTASTIFFGRDGQTADVNVWNGDFIVDTDTLFVDASANSVGVGTTNPDQKFHVEFANTDTSFSGGSGGAWGSEGIRIENTSSTADTMAMLHLRNGDADIHIAGIRQGTNDSDLGFFFEGTQKVLFENTGNATFAGDLKVQGSSDGIRIDSVGHATLSLDRGSTSYDNNLIYRTNGTIKWRLWQDGSDDYLYIRDEANASNIVTFETGGNTTFTGQVIFPSAATTKPVLPNGFISRNDNSDTSGRHDIWGISERYYPSNSTSSDAWGIQWSGTPNDIVFVGAGTDVVSISLDEGNATFAGDVRISNGVTRLISNQLQSGYNQNTDNTDFWINYQGYQGGTTYFRDFRIGDGKQGEIAHFDGSTKDTTFAGNVVIGTVDSVVTGLNIGEASPTIQLFDTTNDAKLLMYTQDNSSIIGTYSNHPLAFYTDSGLTLTLNTDHSATFAGDINIVAGKKLQYSANSFITPENNTSGAEISTAGTFIVKTGATPTLGLTLDTAQNATFAGDVGIGGAPSAALDITTAGNTTDGTYYSTFTINNTGTSTWSRIRFDRSGVARWGLALGTDDKFKISNLFTGGTTADPNDNVLVIDEDSQVGIGTASPTNTLEVASDGDNSGINIFNDFASGGRNARLGFKSLNSYDASSVLAAITADPDASSNTATALTFSTSGNNSLASAGLKTRLRIDSSGLSRFQSDNTYVIGLLDSAGTDQWWFRSFTNGNFAIHENGVGDKFTIAAGGNATFAGAVIATGAVQVPYAAGTKKPMIVLQSATNYGLFHTEASNDIFSFDFNGSSKHEFKQDGTATFTGDTFTPGLYVNTGGSAVSGTQVAIVKDGDQNLQRWGSSTSGQASYRFRIDENFKFIGNSGGGDKITIDSATGDIDTDGDITIGGNLTVTGTSTAVNVEDLNVEQGEITLNYAASSDTSSSANGAGIRIQDAVNATTDATILWDKTNSQFTFSHAAKVNNDLLIGDQAGSASTQAFGAFDQLRFDNSHSSSNVGPNKIVMHDNGGAWIGGFGIHSDTVSYYSGNYHRFYKTTSQTASTLLFESGGTKTEFHNDLEVGGVRIVHDNDSADQGTAFIRSNGDYLVLNAADGEHVYLNWDTANGGSGDVFVRRYIYAEALYDGGNTAYYVDPAGGSVLAGGITVDGDSIFDDNLRVNGWIRGASDTNTLYSSTSYGTLLQTPGNTAGNNNSKIFFRDSAGNNKHTFDTNNGNATIPGAVNGVVQYTKAYASLDTTGQAVAGLGTSSNGASAMFVFETGGGNGSGGYQKIVYNCINVSGTWNTHKDIDEGGNLFDVVASANGSTITFTFKARSSTQSYTPKVIVKAVGGSAINTTYI